MEHVGAVDGPPVLPVPCVLLVTAAGLAAYGLELRRKQTGPPTEAGYPLAAVAGLAAPPKCSSDGDLALLGSCSAICAEYSLSACAWSLLPPEECGH